MNFKTTIVLLVLLVAAGVAVFFVSEKGNTESTPEQTAQAQKLLPDVNVADVTKLTITSVDGKKTTLEKDAGAWRLTEPVGAPAQTFEVDTLLRTITGLESTNTVSPDPSMGLEKPRYTIDLTTSANKTSTIKVGEKSAVGDSVYVLLSNDSSKARLVTADLVASLQKPANTYRDPKLVDLQTSQVQQITISKPDGKIVLAKSGQDWKIIEPTSMPAEKSDVDDILFGLTGLRAAEFVSEDLKDAAVDQLDPPRYSATLVAGPTTVPSLIAAPTTKSSTAPTSQPTTVTIRFGRYDDVQKRNVLVTSSQTPVIAKAAATIIETINKKPLDLRDRKVLDIDAAQVSRIEIKTDTEATTKPTTKQASHTEVSIRRRKEAATKPTTAVAVVQPTTTPATGPATTQATTGPSTTQATTGPSTTQAATQPATQPVTKWETLTANNWKPAEDSKVDPLLSQLHPLRATKFRESATTQPTATYVIQITTQAAGGAEPVKTELRLVDPGNGQPLIGSYNGIAFEVDRSLIDRLSGDFNYTGKPAANESAPETPGPSFGPQ